MKRKGIQLFVLSVVISGLMIGCAKEEDPVGPGALDRDKLLGNWSVISHHTQFGTQPYDMSIVASSNASNEIVMDNFNDIGTGHAVSATVSVNYISIPQKKYATSNGDETIQGSGQYNNNGTLTFNYISNDGLTIDTVTATATRK